MLRDIFGTHFAPSRNAEMHLRGDYMLRRGVIGDRHLE